MLAKRNFFLDKIKVFAFTVMKKDCPAPRRDRIKGFGKVLE